jgi:hypothetical protein
MPDQNKSQTPLRTVREIKKAKYFAQNYPVVSANFALGLEKEKNARIEAQEVLIAEQNKLGFERQEWALKNADTIRGLKEQNAALVAALKALIAAATKFTIGCNCQGAAADDDFSDELDRARQALALTRPV